MSYTTEIVYSSAFDDTLLARAFAIYKMCYAPTDKAVFDADFRAKSYVVLILKDGTLVGFSTAELLTVSTGARVIFSGDTVTHPDHWGTQVLPVAWLRQSGAIWSEAPDVPLYWMLITKGHRTFRYLPAFSLDYQPSPDRQMNPQAKALMDELATSKFGARYNPKTGIIAADPMMPTSVADAMMGRSNTRNGAFFEKCNPGFHRGDELVTLCRLSPDTLTARARKWFTPVDEPA